MPTSPEKRRERARVPPELYEELTDKQKAVLDLACFEGSVLIVGRRMAAWVQSAKTLVRKGVLACEDGTRFYEPTPFGLQLYEARKRR